MSNEKYQFLSKDCSKFNLSLKLANNYLKPDISQYS